MNIGFDVDSKKIVVCAAAEGQKDWHTTLKPDVKKFGSGWSGSEA
jgi:hypothetical protein